MATSTLTDWRSIEDDREKYQAYLCSHEWAKLKTAVHERAGDNCERCGQFPINAVHHLTYARKYAEGLADLAGWCKHCHSFTHEKHWFDPKEWRGTVRYMKNCALLNRPAVPLEALEYQYGLRRDIMLLLSIIDHAVSLFNACDNQDNELLESAVISMDKLLPFAYYGRPLHEYDRLGPDNFYWIARLLDVPSPSVDDDNWNRPLEDEEI